MIAFLVHFACPDLCFCLCVCHQQHEPWGPECAPNERKRKEKSRDPAGRRRRRRRRGLSSKFPTLPRTLQSGKSLHHYYCYYLFISSFSSFSCLVEPWHWCTNIAASQKWNILWLNGFNGFKRPSKIFVLLSSKVVWYTSGCFYFILTTDSSPPAPRSLMQVVVTTFRLTLELFFLQGEKKRGLLLLIARRGGGDLGHVMWVFLKIMGFGVYMKPGKEVFCVSDRVPRRAQCWVSSIAIM